MNLVKKKKKTTDKFTEETKIVTQDLAPKKALG